MKVKLHYDQRELIGILIGCENLCNSLSCLKMRAIAKRNQEMQANKMLERSKKRFKPAEDGDNVNVPIPEVDRGRLDPANFTAGSL